MPFLSTDPTASNFAADALIDDGSCDQGDAACWAYVPMATPTAWTPSGARAKPRINMPGPGGLHARESRCNLIWSARVNVTQGCSGSTPRPRRTGSGCPSGMTTRWCGALKTGWSNPFQ